MKKIVVIFTAIIFFGNTASAQFKTSDYPVWIDSITSEPILKNFQMYSSDEFVLTKNGLPYEVVEKNHKVIIRDIRIKIPAGTPGKVVDITYQTDTVQVPTGKMLGSMPIMKTVTRTKKVIWVQYDIKGNAATVPYTAGFNPASQNSFGLDLKMKKFKFGEDEFQAEGASTIQVDSKLIAKIRMASGNKF